MKTITIHVTAEDIAKHGRGSVGGDRCAECPVAVAMTRTLKRPVWVLPRWWGFDMAMDNKLPFFVGEKIRAIDSGNFPKPFSFEIEVP